MASLKGSTIASSYKSLLKLNENSDTLAAGNGSNAIQIVHSDDSTGVTSPLFLNTDRLGIGGQPSNQLTVVGDNVIKNINIYTNSDSAVTADTGARIFTTGDGGSGIYGENGHLVIQGRPSNARDVIFIAGNSATEVGRLDSDSRINLSNNGGTSNTVFGYQAGNLIGSGDNYNVFIGHQVADADMTNATNNVGVGYQSLSALTEGDNNIALGYQSSDAITTGSANVAIGTSSLGANTATHNNVAVGTSVLQSLEASSQNTALGSSAMASIGTNASGLANCVAVGYQAFQGGTSTTTGANGTVAIGMNSLHGLTTGANNTAVGYQSADALTTGAQNTAIGDSALGGTVDGTSNTAVGAYAMSGGDAHLYNTAIGGQSLSDVTGSSNTALGFQSGNTGTNDITSGIENTLIGSQTATSSATANNQIVIGKGEVGYGDYTASIGGTVLGLNIPNTMSSPYYRFDGVDDYIQILADGTGTFNTQKFSIEALVYMDGTSSYYQIWSYDFTAHSNPYYSQHLRVNTSSNTLILAWNNGSGNQSVEVANAVEFNKWQHIVATFENQSQKLYVNGSLIGTSATTATITYYNQEVWIGKANFSGGEFAGEMQKVRFFNNVLDATEVKELYSGISVPYKYKGSSITSMINNGDFVNGSTTGFYGGWSHDTSNNEADYTASGNDESQLSIQGAVAFVKDREYQLVFTVANVSSGALKLKWFIGSDEAITQADYTNGTHTVLFTSPVSASANFTAKARNSGQGGASGSITNVALTRAGAVAEYDGSSIGEKVWGDKSGNSLDGTVEGPTVENAPYDAGTEYEEGTFTPSIVSSGGVTFTAGGGVVGQYVRIGNQVTLNGFVIVNGLNSADATQTITLQGLPYGGRTGTRAAVTFGNNEGMAMTDGDHIQGIIYETNTVINLYVTDATGSNATNMLGSEWSDDGRTYFTVTYFTD